jgi:hypothetical protein
LAKGLNEVSLVVVKFNAVEKELLRKPSDSPETKKVQSELELRVVRLFSAIIEYQAKAVRYYIRSSVVRLLRDVFNTDNWNSMIEQISRAKTSCMELMARISDDRSRARFDRQVRRAS